MEWRYHIKDLFAATEGAWKDNSADGYWLAQQYYLAWYYGTKAYERIDVSFSSNIMSELVTRQAKGEDLSELTVNDLDNMCNKEAGKRSKLQSGVMIGTLIAGSIGEENIINEGEGEAKATIDYVKLSKELGKKIEADGYEVIDTETAEQANKDWADMGFDKPPVAENTTVYNVEAGSFSYSRVYLEGYNRPMGNFILRTEDIEGLSAKEIAQKYALSQVPNKIVTIELPSNTPLEVSIVGPQESWVFNMQ